MHMQPPVTNCHITVYVLSNRCPWQVPTPGVAIDPLLGIAVVDWIVEVLSSNVVGLALVSTY